MHVLNRKKIIEDAETITKNRKRHILHRNTKLLIHLVFMISKCLIDQRIYSFMSLQSHRGANVIYRLEYLLTTCLPA